jgi:hypothetical protein
MSGSRWWCRDRRFYVSWSTGPGYGNIPGYEGPGAPSEYGPGGSSRGGGDYGPPFAGAPRSGWQENVRTPGVGGTGGPSGGPSDTFTGPTFGPPTGRFSKDGGQDQSGRFVPGPAGPPTGSVGGAISPYYANQRAQLMAELDRDPRLRAPVAATLDRENRGHGHEGRADVLEAVVNRAIRDKDKSLRIPSRRRIEAVRHSMAHTIQVNRDGSWLICSRTLTRPLPSARNGARGGKFICPPGNNSTSCKLQRRLEAAR